MSARDPVHPADVVHSVALDSLTHRDRQATAVTVRVLLPLRQTNKHIQVINRGHERVAQRTGAFPDNP